MPPLLGLREGAGLIQQPPGPRHPSLPQPQGQPQPARAGAARRLCGQGGCWRCILGTACSQQSPGSSLYSSHPPGCREKPAHLRSLINVIMRRNAKNCTRDPLMNSQPDICLRGSWLACYLQQQDLLVLGFDLHNQKYPQN